MLRLGPLNIRIPDLLLRLAFTGSLRVRPCTHRHLVQSTKPPIEVCEACLVTGDRWPGLRMCLICGFVGCCDQSKNKHMLRHYQETGHPLIRSIDPGEVWAWCYPDEAFLTAEQLPALRAHVTAV